MTIEFENLEYTTDKGKTVPKLEHKFVPLKETDPSIVITCEYFKTGELMQYMDMTTNGKVNYRFRDIFMDKVKHIEGISIKDKKTNKEIKVEDAETFLMLPSKAMCEQLITIVAAHIIAGDKLTEDEEKN